MPCAAPTPCTIPDRLPEFARKTTTFVAARRGGKTAGITSGTVTCATTREPARMPAHGTGLAKRSSPPVIFAFVTSIWSAPSRTSRTGPFTFETTESTVERARR